LNRVYFLNKYCRTEQHTICERQWSGFGFEIYCECFCHKKNVATERLSNPSSVAVETSTLENKVNVQ